MLRALPAVLVAGSLVAGIVRTPRPAFADGTISAVELDSRLQSLRRSAENATDVKAVLDRYARFIEQYKDTPAAKEAERDVALWRERQGKGMVKVGASWVTPGERQTLKSQATSVAAEARDALLAKRTKDAEALVHKALGGDPANPSACYLNGLLLYGQAQLQPSRKAFEAALAGGAQDAATYNDLAVVLWKCNQQSLALPMFEKAMLASPGNGEVLHNVAEAVNSLPPNQRTTVVAQNAIRLYEVQQQELARRMQQEFGLHAWGSQWVDDSTLAQLAAAQKQIDAKLLTLSGQFDEVRKQADQAATDIANNNRVIQQIEQNSKYVDSKGITHQKPYPSLYFELKKQNDDLTSQKNSLDSKMATIRFDAERTRESLPLKKYGTPLLLIGAELTPGLPPVEATVSATQPTAIPVARVGVQRTAPTRSR
jgi:hypothetical protein